MARYECRKCRNLVSEKDVVIVCPDSEYGQIYPFHPDCYLEYKRNGL